MKKLFALLILLTAILSLNQAQAQTETAAQTVSEALKFLNGSWEWTETKRMSRGVKPSAKTPASEGKKITVTFKPDNQASVFENGKLVGTYAYKLSQPGNENIMITFSDEMGNNPAAKYLEEGPLTVSANEMYIAGNYNDAGSNQTFRKIQATKTTKPEPKKK